jgi:hypothetical protein
LPGILALGSCSLFWDTHDFMRHIGLVR